MSLQTFQRDAYSKSPRASAMISHAGGRRLATCLAELVALTQHCRDIGQVFSPEDAEKYAWCGDKMTVVPLASARALSICKPPASRRAETPNIARPKSLISMGSSRPTAFAPLSMCDLLTQSPVPPKLIQDSSVQGLLYVICRAATWCLSHHPTDPHSPGYELARSFLLRRRP